MEKNFRFDFPYILVENAFLYKKNIDLEKKLYRIFVIIN